MAGSPFDDLVHRVNNLLGTIEVQAQVASTDGTLEAHEDAMRLILDSARRTAAEVQRLRAQAQSSDGR